MDNRFVFIAPAYNAEGTVERMLSSIFLQSWTNWKVLIKDDLSTDDTVWKIVKVCDKFNIKWCVKTDNNDLGAQQKSAKVVVWVNDEKKWEVQNVLEMIRSDLVKDDDIICRIDCDDALSDLCALQDIDLVYKNTNCDVVWTSHRWSWNFTKSISGPIPGGYVFDPRKKSLLLKCNGEKNPYKNEWKTSHLKTFRKELINNVDEENFKGKDGEYIKRTGDQAIYLPVLHKSKMPVYLPRQVYYYEIEDVPETYQTDDAKFQADEASFLRGRGFVNKKENKKNCKKEVKNDKV